MKSIQFNNLHENYKFLREVARKCIRLDITDGLNQVYDEKQKQKIMIKF